MMKCLAILAGCVCFSAAAADAIEPPNGGFTELHRAMASGDFEKMKAAVTNAPGEINAKFPAFAYGIPGETALHMALHHSRPHERMMIVEYLIAHGADVNAQTASGVTPLLEAAGSKELSDFLVSKGAKFDIYTAVALNRIDQIELRLKEKPELANEKLPGGETPLFHVRSFEAAEMLIASGADVNARNRYDCTPLWGVADRKIAELLVAHGADVHVKSSKHMNTPLFPAAVSGRVDVVEYLLENGVDANGAFANGLTAMHHTSNVKIIAMLLAKGADVNARANNGETPLFYASEQAVKFLIEQGADINARNKQGKTVLHDAAERSNDAPKAELLLTLGAKVDATDENGQTPLHIAYHKAYVEVLLAHGANVNAKDNEGRTPLHIKKNADTVALLLSKGADVNARDKSGNTPLHTLKYVEEEAALLRKQGGVE